MILPELPSPNPSSDMSLLLELYLPAHLAPQSHCASAPDDVLPEVTFPKHYISQATVIPNLI